MTNHISCDIKNREVIILILKNASVCNDNFEFINTDITIEDGKIKSLEKSEESGIDCTGCVILPGFIDIHIHGCNMADCTDGKPDSVAKMGRFLAEHGITSFCPTTMTLPVKELENSFSYIKETMGKEEGAYIHGINMEGPFISPKRKGAQAEENIKEPDFELFSNLNKICNVKIVDIAPEVNGASEFIEKAKNICRVSAAHTEADYATIKKAESLGLKHATHLFNAMTQLGSREPGAVGAVFDSDKITAELICDGIHISPATLRIAFKILGENRTVIISDAMMAAGLEDGEYTLGGQRVIKKGAARLADGTLAGSVTNLFDEFKNAISWGIPLKQAIKSVTINPAKCIGADKYTGSIKEGKNADLIILKNDFSELYNVIIKGNIYK